MFPVSKLKIIIHMVFLMIWSWFSTQTLHFLMDQNYVKLEVCGSICQVVLVFAGLLNYFNLEGGDSHHQKIMYNITSHGTTPLDLLISAKCLGRFNFKFSTLDINWFLH